MSKTLSIIVILISIFIETNSQERVNKSLPKISVQVNSQLTQSKGWILSPEGQWISRQNRIPSYLDNKYKTISDLEFNGLGMDNFISFQIRDILIDGKSYKIIIKRYKDGYYKYLSIKQGWTNYTSVNFFVIEENEFYKLNTIINDSVNQIKLKVLYSGELTWINDQTLLSDIQKEVVKLIEDLDKTKKEEKHLVFHLAPYKSKNIVQFQIYSTSGAYNIIGGVIQEHRIKSKSSSYDERIYLTDELFKHCYYEVDYITFNKFIKLN